jgi:hypothetical protein
MSSYDDSGDDSVYLPPQEDVSGSQGIGRISPQSQTLQVQQEPDEAQSFYPNEKDLPLPTFIPGGVDSGWAQTQKKIDTLARQRPVYQYADGTVTYNYVPPTGTRIPIQGEATFSGGTGAISVQQQQIQELQKQKPLFADSDIFQNRQKIMSDLASNSPTGKLDREGFFDNPYWDKLRATGASEDNIRRAQNTTLHAIQPLLKAQQAQDAYKGIVTDALDSAYGSEFANEPLNKQKLIAAKGTKGGAAMWNAIKEKSDILETDSDKAEIFTAAREDPNQNDYNNLLRVKTSSGFYAMLNTIMGRKEKLDQKHEAMINSQGSNLEGLKGDAVTAVQDQFAKMTKERIFDKGNEHLAPRWLDYAKKNIGDEDGNVTVGYKDAQGNAQEVKIPSLYNSVHEKGLSDERKKLNEANVQDDDMLIGITSTGTPKIFHGESKDNFIHQDIINRFGDTSLKGNGQYVKIPTGLLKDSAENDVFIELPTAPNIKGELGATTYTYKNDQYVDRTVLQKLGLSNDLIKEAMKDGTSITIDPKYNSILKGEAPEYQPIAMSMKDFMDDDRIKQDLGVQDADGHRLDQNKAFIDHMAVMRSLADKNAKTNALAWTDIPHDDPSFLMEATKGFTKGIINALIVSPAALGWGIGTSIDSLVRGVYDKATGDDRAAKEAFSTINPLTNIRSALTAYDEAVDQGGMLDLDKLNSDPRATWQQKAVFAGGDLVGNLIGLGGKVKMVETAFKTPEITEAILGLGTKLAGYEASMTRLASAVKAGTATAEDVQLLNTQRKVFNVVKSSLDWVGLSLMQGEDSPANLAIEATKGGALGTGGLFGRGITWNQWYPSMSRLAGGSVAGAATVGLDAIRMLFEWKTKEQMVDQLKDPGYWVGIGSMALFPLFGNHALPESVRPAPKPIPEPRAEVPSMEHFDPEKASTQELIDFAHQNKDNAPNFTQAQDIKFGDAIKKINKIIADPKSNLPPETMESIADLYGHPTLIKYDQPNSIKVQERDLATTKEKIDNIIKTADKVENGTAGQLDLFLAKKDIVDGQVADTAKTTPFPKVKEQSDLEAKDPKIQAALKGFAPQVEEIIKKKEEETYAIPKPSAAGVHETTHAEAVQKMGAEVRPSEGATKAQVQVQKEGATKAQVQVQKEGATNLPVSPNAGVGSIISKLAKSSKTIEEAWKAQKPSLRAQRADKGGLSEAAFEKQLKTENLPSTKEIIQGADGRWRASILAPEGLRKVTLGEPNITKNEAEVLADKYVKENYGKQQVGKAMAETIPSRGGTPAEEAMAKEEDEFYKVHVANLAPFVKQGISFEKLIGSSLNEFEGDKIKAAQSVMDAISNHAEAIYSKSGDLSQVKEFLKTKTMEVPNDIQDHIMSNLQETVVAADNQLDEKEKNSKVEEAKDGGCSWATIVS